MPPHRCFVVALCGSCLLVSRPSLVIAWQLNGNPVCTAPGLQQIPTGAADGAGGVYIAWLDARGGGNVYAQRIVGDGSIAPGWPVNGLALTTAGMTGPLAAVPDGNGGLLVIYFRHPSPGAIYAQRVTASGAIAPGFPADGKLITTDATGSMAATTDGEGGAYVFRSGRPELGDLYSPARLTRITSDGVIAPSWSEAGVHLAGGFGASASGLGATANPQGGAICSWAGFIDGGPGGNQTYATAARIRPNGSVAQYLHADAPLSGGEAPGIGEFQAAPDGRSGILATWRDTQPIIPPYPGQTGCFGTHQDSSSAFVWPLTPLPTTLTPIPDGTGAAYLMGKPTGQTAFVAYRRLGNGTIPPGWTAGGIPLSNPVSTEAFASLAIPAGLLTCWSERTSGAGNDIRAVVLTSAGTVGAGWTAGGNAVCTAAGSQLGPIFVPDGTGGVVTCWLDLRDNATTGQDIYAAKLLAEGVVAAQASLVAASAGPGVIRLHWFTPDGAAFAARLERAVNGAGFAPLAEVRADGAGHVHYEDREVVAGATYRYRLVVADAGGPLVLGEVSLRVPDAMTLALEPPRPNPSTGDFTLGFVLPGAAPARIEVLDVTGRRVLSRAYAAGHAGQHVLPLNDDLVPGVYLVKLTHEGRSVTTRLVRSE